LFKFDLKSGYHHIDIHPDHQKYIGFSFKIQGITRYFVFTCLPFGLSSAPHVFTKVIRPLVKSWRLKGYKIVVYLDDGFCFNYSLDKSIIVISKCVHSDIVSSGFLPNYEKSVWSPTRTLEWIGFIWNMELGEIQISPTKISIFKKDISSILSCLNSTSARDLAKITCKIISFSECFGSICWFMTRFLHFSICSRTTWEKPLFVCEQTKKELEFWFQNIDTIPYISIVDSVQVPETIVYTDASGHSCAGYCLQFSDVIVHKTFNAFEKNKSSTWRELNAIIYCS